ncbi:MAG: SseB family protein [Clostridia bacterium]|nr:SseB family protein [Clostridia bacterium]
MTARDLADAAERFRAGEAGAKEQMTEVLRALFRENVRFFAAADVHIGEDVKNIKQGDRIPCDKIKVKFKTVSTHDGKHIALFTSEEEMKKGPKTSSLTVSLQDAVKTVKGGRAVGIVFNPFSAAVVLPQSVIEKFTN